MEDNHSHVGMGKVGDQALMALAAEEGDAGEVAYYKLLEVVNDETVVEAGRARH